MNVYNLTRDELPNFNPSTSVPGRRFIACDFNHNGHKTKVTKAALVAIPDNLTKQEELFCELYLEMVVSFFKFFGHEVENRGLVRAGYPGIIHTEPFFTKDSDSLNIILQHSQTYAFILASTLGCIHGSQIILPHKKIGKDMGAVTSSGMSERGLARYIIMPHLIRSYGEATVETYNDLFEPMMAQEQASQVSFTELS